MHKEIVVCLLDMRCRLAAPKLCSRTLHRFEHRLAHPILVPTRLREQCRVLRADDVERGVVHRPPEGTPLSRRSPAECRGELVGCAAAVVGDRKRCVAGHEGHRRGAGRKAALDVQRLPRARLLVLGKAAGDLAGMTERRAIEPPGPGATGQGEDEPERATDRDVGARPRAERAHAGVEPDLLANRTVDDEDRAGRLGGDGDAVRIESRLQRRLDRGDDDGKICRPAPGEHRAGRDALERRLAVSGRHEAERPGGIASGEHRLHALGRGRYHRQPVAPAALEHVLELVQPGDVRVVSPARHAAGLRARLPGERYAEQPLVPLRVPADDDVGDHASRLDPDRSRHGRGAESLRDLVRLLLREHRMREVRPPCEPSRLLGVFLRDADDANGAVYLAQPAQGQRGRRAVGVREDEDDRPVGQQLRERDRIAVDARQREVECDGGHAQSVRPRAGARLQAISQRSGGRAPARVTGIHQSSRSQQRGADRHR